jgi:hypothetical protein
VTILNVKALVSFSGLVTMQKGEEREIRNKEIYDDLLKANYIEEVKTKATKKKVKSNEN